MDTLNSILKFIGNKLKIITDKYTTTGIVNTGSDFNIDCTNLNINGNCLINGANIVDSGAVTFTGTAPGSGYWVRLYDGTQICWRQGTTTAFTATHNYGSLYQGVMNFDFPRTFVGDRPIASPCVAKYSSGATWASYSSVSLSSFSLRMFDIVSRPSGGNTVFGFIAIGRWK